MPKLTVLWIILRNSSVFRVDRKTVCAGINLSVYAGLAQALVHPHNSNPRPASAAALLRQELAATSAAGAFDADSNGSDATAE